jgi:phosphoribosyl 1,2-cyclic phosphate phosphodiesterase
MAKQLTILGCGSSGGVPRIGDNWGACDPRNPNNRRLRCSVAVEQITGGGKTSILVDTSTDLREQMLKHGLNWLDGVLFTHDHADHTHGIDELRVVAINHRRRLHAYFDSATARTLNERFRYCFETPEGSFYRPFLEAHNIVPLEPFTIEGDGGPVEVLSFEQRHGQGMSLGFRFGNIAYSPDISGLPEDSVSALKNLDVWILNSLRYAPHPSHLSVGQALELIEHIGPNRAVLTHLHIDLDYQKLRQKLPANVEPAYDGMIIEFE